MYQFFKQLSNRLAQLILIILIASCSFQANAEDWVYTVRPGDTLWDLCLEYTTEKACWQKVGPYNGVDYPPSLAPGTRINFPSAWLKQQPVSAEIIFVRGEVFVEGIEPQDKLSLGSMTLGEASISDLRQQQEPQTKATPGMTLLLGVRVSTGKASTASLKFADGSILILEEGSEIVLDLLSQHGSTGMVDSRIRLLRGSARSKVREQQPRSKFSVSSPSAVAAVRGTEFSLAIAPQTELASLSSVFEGKVEIQQIRSEEPTEPAESLTLAKGYGIRVHRDQPLPSPIPLLPAPELIEQKIVSLPLTLEWQAVVDATSYQLQLFQAEQENLITTLATTLPSISVPNLDHGCYRGRLSAIDKNDLLGMPRTLKFCAERPPTIPSITLAEFKHKELKLAWHAEPLAHATRIELYSDKDMQKPIYRETVSGNSVEYSLEKQKTIYARVCSLGRYGLEGGCVQTERLGKHSRAWQVLVVFLVGTLALL